MKKHYPRVVIAGRINAGKSTLFNRLAERGQALVSAVPGTTRDLNFTDINWQDKTFTLVDTGGLDAGQLGAIEIQAQHQARQAIAKADLVLMLIDGRGEVQPEDRQFMKWLKKIHKNSILVINKIDSQNWENRVSPDIHKIGARQYIYVSSINGRNTGDLLDLITGQVGQRVLEPLPVFSRISIIGRTNVGKSSLVNALIGEIRMIVTPHPHTTREAQDISFVYQGRRLIFVDTAGIRKNKSKADQLEKISIEKTVQAMKKTDISLMMIDVSQPLTSQDQHIGQLASRFDNGIILIANKWDLCANQSLREQKTLREKIYRYYPQFTWAPILFISATQKFHLSQIMSAVIQVQTERQTVLSQEQLDNILASVRLKRQHHDPAAKYPVLTRLRQVESNPPVFLLTAKRAGLINPAFLQLIEKKIRQTFPYLGTPCQVNLAKSK